MISHNRDAERDASTGITDNTDPGLMDNMVNKPFVLVIERDVICVL